MNVYLSGALLTTSPAVYEKRLWDVGVRNRCYSYYYLTDDSWKKKTLEAYEASMKLGMGIFLDSGAHTFHRIFLKGRFGQVEKGIQKFTDAYIQFCLANKSKWNVYVTFDYRRNAAICWEIQKQFEKHNLKPMPVFHGDVSPEFMQKYLDKGYEEIGISPVLMEGNRADNYRYLCKCFEVLCDGNGVPKVRVHGFGVGMFEQLSTFPWATVDNATWCRTAAYGRILIFDWRRGRSISTKITKRKSDGGLSFWKFTRSERMSLEKIIEEQGFSLEELSSEEAVGQQTRALFNAKMFVAAANKLAVDKF